MLDVSAMPHHLPSTSFVRCRRHYSSQAAGGRCVYELGFQVDFDSCHKYWAGPGTGPPGAIADSSDEGSDDAPDDVDEQPAAAKRKAKQPKKVANSKAKAKSTKTTSSSSKKKTMNK